MIVRQILFKVSPNIKNGEDVPHHFVFIAIPLCIYSAFRSDIVVYGFLGDFTTRADFKAFDFTVPQQVIQSVSSDKKIIHNFVNGPYFIII